MHKPGGYKGQKHYVEMVSAEHQPSVAQKCQTLTCPEWISLCNNIATESAYKQIKLILFFKGRLKVNSMSRFTVPETVSVVANQPAYRNSTRVSTPRNWTALQCRGLFMVRKGTMSCGVLLLMRKIHWEARADLRPQPCNSTSINYHKTRALSKEPQMQGFTKITARLSKPLFPNCPFQ